MTRFEEMLLNSMTVRRWCLTVFVLMIGAGVGGYFSGRAILMHEIRREMNRQFEQAQQELKAAGNKWFDDVNRRQAEIDEHIKRESQNGGGR